MPRGYLFAGEEEAEAEVIVLVVVEGGRPSCKLVIREQGVDLNEASSKEGGAREDEDEDKELATCCRTSNSLLPIAQSSVAVVVASRPAAWRMTSLLSGPAPAPAARGGVGSG